MNKRTIILISMGILIIICIVMFMLFKNINKRAYDINGTVLNNIDTLVTIGDSDNDIYTFSLRDIDDNNLASLYLDVHNLIRGNLNFRE